MYYVLMHANLTWPSHAGFGGGNFIWYYIPTAHFILDTPLLGSAPPFARHPGQQSRGYLLIQDSKKLFPCEIRQDRPDSESQLGIS